MRWHGLSLALKKNRSVQVQFNLRTPNVTEEARDKPQKTYAWEAVLMPSWTKKFGTEKPFVF